MQSSPSTRSSLWILTRGTLAKSVSALCAEKMTIVVFETSLTVLLKVIYMSFKNRDRALSYFWNLSQQRGTHFWGWNAQKHGQVLHDLVGAEKLIDGHGWQLEVDDDHWLLLDIYDDVSANDNIQKAVLDVQRIRSGRLVQSRQPLLRICGDHLPIGENIQAVGLRPIDADPNGFLGIISVDEEQSQIFWTHASEVHDVTLPCRKKLFRSRKIVIIDSWMGRRTKTLVGLYVSFMYVISKSGVISHVTCKKCLYFHFTKFVQSVKQFLQIKFVFFGSSKYNWAYIQRTTWLKNQRQNNWVKKYNNDKRLTPIT